jgi:hypothetical protein
LYLVLIQNVGEWGSILESLQYMVHSHNGFFWIKRILSEQETDHFGFFIRPSRDGPYYVIGYGRRWASTQVSAQ